MMAISQVDAFSIFLSEWRPPPSWICKLSAVQSVNSVNMVTRIDALECPHFQPESDNCAYWLNCAWLRRVLAAGDQGANSDAGSQIGNKMDWHTCACLCVNSKDSCMALDYNLRDNNCFAHPKHQQITHRQPNTCCDRYEYTCNREYIRFIS